MYKDENKKRATTRERVKRFRKKQKGVTEGVTCPVCGGRGYTEEEGGLIMRPCKECKK